MSFPRRSYGILIDVNVKQGRWSLTTSLRACQQTVWLAPLSFAMATSRQLLILVGVPSEMTLRARSSRIVSMNEFMDGNSFGSKQVDLVLRSTCQEYAVVLKGSDEVIDHSPKGFPIWQGTVRWDVGMNEDH